jgi:hypothetical protein
MSDYDDSEPEDDIESISDVSDTDEGYSNVDIIPFCSLEVEKVGRSINSSN